MSTTNRGWLAAVALLAVAGGAYWYLTRSTSVEAPAEVSSPPTTTPGDVIRHPVEEIEQDAVAAGETVGELPALDASDAAVEGAVADLLQGAGVLDLAGAGDYIRRIVATVDNLARSRASPRMWPVPPTPGRLAVREGDGHTYLATENFQRYAPFVNVATSVDVDRLVASYVRFYPLLQQAYEGLGYPGQYFNDRVVDVIDVLLATPEPGDTIELILPPQDPSVEIRRPWLLYQYADPALESLTAGQKILIRMGSESSGRIKATLRELRSRLATVPRPAAASPATTDP